jgi:predicted DCC family thiol-disulfide oxidoreductase YuxK
MPWLRRRWQEFWFAPASPTNLGVCRVLFFGGILLLYLAEDFSAWAGVSRVFWRPIWLFTSLHLPILPGPAIIVMQVIWKVALWCSCIGLLTRPSTMTSFGLGVYLMGLPHNFGKTHHYDTVVVLVLGIMALSRCGDGWSADRLIRVVRRGIDLSARPLTLSGEYTWPIRMVWLVLALIYFAAGVSKVRHGGLEWIVSDNMAIMLIQHQYHIANDEPLTTWGLYVAQYGWLSQFLAAATVVFETSYALALFSRRARWVIVPAMLSVQAGIRILMGPTFGSFLVCMLFWIPWEHVGDRLATWLSRGRKHMLLFDGGCGLCQGTVAVIHSLDLLRRIELCDAFNRWPEIAARFPHLDQGACLEDMHLITATGQVYTGFEAYRRLAWILPLGWIALPLLYLPGVRPIGQWVYRIVASRRQSSCPLPPV